MYRAFSTLAAAALVLAACDSTSGPQNGAGVSIQFKAVSSAGLSAGGGGGPADFTITGNNGTLTLTDVHLIVDEFELARADGACAGGADRDRNDHECEVFESGPFFIGLELGSDVSVTAQDVPAGTYTKLTFKVEDTDFDADDRDIQPTTMQDLMKKITDAGYTDWPSNASMVVSGVFTPLGEAPRPFTAYLAAELRIGENFQPPLVVEDNPSTITIEVDPTIWFRGDDGVLIDLSEWDYDTTHRVIEFQTQLRDAFLRMQHQHD